MAWCSNFHGIAKYLKCRDVSLLCCDPTSTQYGKVHGCNKNHTVASFLINSRGESIMNDLATGNSGGIGGTTFLINENRFFALEWPYLIVDFIELDHKKSINHSSKKTQSNIVWY